MDEKRRELEGFSLLIEDGVITRVEKDIQAQPEWEVIDAGEYWVFPGLVNTHHHFYQVLTRSWENVQQAELFPWLKNLYPVWARLTPRGVVASTRIALAELLKSGCTTASDHHYVFPRGQDSGLIDYQIETAREMGVRFHPSRGSMSLGEDEGGLPPREIVQKESEILEDSLRLINSYHDPSPYSMCQIVLAPCSPFSVTPELLRETAVLARQYGVRCHTHLAETRDEDDFCQKELGMRPLEFMEKMGWTGGDVWYAHGIHFQDEELEVLARTGTGVAHCPVSNQKLSSGVARIPEMLEKDIPVGLAVDGSASNDGSNMLVEMKSALLLHKLYWGIDSMSARKVLEMATLGGARLLGRPDLGSIAPGQAGDLFMVDRRRVGYAGAQSDPVTALLTCGDSFQSDLTIVAGKILVREGKLVKFAEEDLHREAEKESRTMLEKG